MLTIIGIAITLGVALAFFGMILFWMYVGNLPPRDHWYYDMESGEWVFVRKEDCHSDLPD